jgi:fructosamine-3-kinase
MNRVAGVKWHLRNDGNEAIVTEFCTKEINGVMTKKIKKSESLTQVDSIKWISRVIRMTIEDVISRHIRREWSIRNVKDLSELACHHCAIVSDGSFGAFFKYSTEADALTQFEVELASLQYLATRAGVLIPTPIDIVQVEHGTLLVMEALQAVERTPFQWRDIGKTLARIHRITSDRCGFHRDGFIGPIYQDNTPTRDWITFYGECRLWPRLKMTVDSGNLPSSVASQVEQLIRRLPELGGPDITPALLHGDAQQNNFISTAQGTFVIDPAVYYGNPEIDIALIDSWQPVPDEVFESYMEEMPLDAGFEKRRNLWRISIYLAAVAIEGPGHLIRLTNALQGYV